MSWTGPLRSRVCIYADVCDAHLLCGALSEMSMWVHVNKWFSSSSECAVVKQFGIVFIRIEVTLKNSH